VVLGVDVADDEGADEGRGFRLGTWDVRRVGRGTRDEGRAPLDCGVGLWDDFSEAMKKGVGVRLTLLRLLSWM
jgi:hypothetical protein